MSACSRDGDVSAPLRNVLSSVQCVRDRVRDEEPNETNGEFNLSNFWETLTQAAKAVSQEATKLSLSFSRTPLPSLQDAEKLAEFTLNSVLTLSTMYYWLPQSQGLSLRRQVRDATVEVLEGVMQLLEAILTSPSHSVSQEQLLSTGSVWSACDRFPLLPRDNKSAVLSVLSSQLGVVKDAIEEIQQAVSEADAPLVDEELDEDDLHEEQDRRWSDKELRVLAPCQGLAKASAACLRKLTTAVKSNGDASHAHTVTQLDQLGDISKDISPSVDELVLSLYPPMDYSDVENNASKHAALLKKVLCLISSSHVCGEPELVWVHFLDGAVEHNVQRVRELIVQEDS